ncbi:hypothetical protein R1sor_024025 [Riccia sorocarpa]|uniref:Uncharacterized protein n=1 Tax=Riccia sorocarpa TaxID=122646 RepID=A0ABD3GTC7_9MARC
MADDWAAADDDLEKLLDLDDFDVPSVFKSSEIATSLDTKEVETGEIQRKRLPVMNTGKEMLLLLTIPQAPTSVLE